MSNAMPATSSVSLRVQRLRFRYASSGPWTVDIPQLELRAGEQVLLTAGSGRGKSTLLQLIAGLLEPSEGSIAIAGQPLHAMRGAQRDLFRGRNVGMIFQTFNLLHGFTASENVEAALMFSSLPHAQQRDEALRLLTHLGLDRPNALVEELSVGQQQRVAVARAVACSPELVLADEPTASLDPENASTAMDLIQQACREKGAALLCASHDPSMAARFSRRETLAELSKSASGAVA